MSHHHVGVFLICWALGSVVISCLVCLAIDRGMK